MSDAFSTHDGLRLQRHTWPCEAARGTVLIVHGLGEHAGRYAALAATLNGAGWRVCGFDHRGHGRSEGARGDLPAPEATLRDLAGLIDAVRAEWPGPLVLLGHSLGGLIAARLVAEALAPAPAAWARPVDALVLSSPALDPGLSGLQKLMLAVGERLTPGVAVGNGLQASWLSHDAAVVQDYRVDPLVHDRITARLTRFIVDAGRLVRAAAPRWQTPTLLQWAGADRCVAPAGSAEFAAAAPPRIVSTQAWPGLFHEIYNEPERALVLAELTGWLSGIEFSPVAAAPGRPGGR